MPAKKRKPEPKGKQMRIRSDDTVLVTSGKDKGKTGKVLAHRAGQAPGLRGGTQYREEALAPAFRQGHARAATAGGIIDQEGPIHVSNVMLVDPTDNKPTRVGVRQTDDGKRQRYAKRTGNALD